MSRAREKEFPYDTEALCETRKSEVWKPVRVLKPLRDQLIKSDSGKNLTVMRQVLVIVNGEKTPRPMAVERLRGEGKVRSEMQKLSRE